MHLERFRQDVRRWIVPEEISPPEMVTLGTTLKLLFHHMPLRAMLLFRFGSWCDDRGIPFLPGFMQRLIYVIFGLEIGVGTDIGGGLYIAHPIGTVVYVKKMGRNCSLIGGALTIGMNKSHRFPVIGDDVFVGVGARILGDIHIGDGAKIGANAVVLEDVPPGTTAVGIPADLVGVEDEYGEELEQPA